MKNVQMKTNILEIKKFPFSIYNKVPYSKYYANLGYLDFMFKL